MKTLVAFDPTWTRALTALHEVTAARVPQLAEEFGTLLWRDRPLASDERVKRTSVLAEWIDGLFRGPHDDLYFDARSEWTRARVREGAPADLLAHAVGQLRARLLDALDPAPRELLDDVATIRRALNRLLDFELVTMVDAVMNLARELVTAARGLTGDAAHGLRNSLSVIESSVYLLKVHRGPEGDAVAAQAHMVRIAEAIRHADASISRMAGALDHLGPP